MSGFTVSPLPTDEEAAAIMAAYDVLWPRPGAAPAADPAPRWRFAGRWWSPRPGYGGWT